MIKIDKLELRGDLTAYVNDPTKRAHVFLAYVSGIMLIPAVLNGVDTLIQFAFSSMQIALWENGFAVKFPSTEYLVAKRDAGGNVVMESGFDFVTGEPTERPVMEKRYAQKVRPLDDESRVAIKCALRSHPEVEDLIERGACLLRGEEDPGPINA